MQTRFPAGREEKHHPCCFKHCSGALAFCGVLPRSVLSSSLPCGVGDDEGEGHHAGAPSGACREARSEESQEEVQEEENAGRKRCSGKQPASYRRPAAEGPRELFSELEGAARGETGDRPPSSRTFGRVATDHEGLRVVSKRGGAALHGPPSRDLRAVGMAVVVTV